MSDRYGRLTINGNTLLFILQNVSDSLDRDIWELPLPYIRDKLAYDQITTTGDITLTAKIKVGSGYPYSSIKEARDAKNALLPDAEISSCVLEEGTYNGSFTQSSSLAWNLPDSGRILLLKNISFTESVELLDVANIVITFTQGGQL